MNATAPLAMLGAWQWGGVLVLALLLFGHRIPGIARGLGSTLGMFRRGRADRKDDREPKGSGDRER